MTDSSNGSASEDHSHDYGVAAFQAVLTFIGLIIIATLVEGSLSDAADERDRERVILDSSLGNIAEFSSSLSLMRSALARFAGSSSELESANEAEYRNAYRRYSAAKPQFIIGMTRANLGDQNIIDAFGKLNAVTIALDACVLSREHEVCELQARVEEFNILSGKFEELLIANAAQN